jgi:hypothetical protein
LIERAATGGEMPLVTLVRQYDLPGRLNSINVKNAKLATFSIERAATVGDATGDAWNCRSRNGDGTEEFVDNADEKPIDASGTIEILEITLLHEVKIETPNRVQKIKSIGFKWLRITFLHS